MPTDNRMEETVPSRRADRGRSGETGTRPPPPRIPTPVWVFAFILGILLFAFLSVGMLYLLEGQRGAAGPTPTAIIWTVTPSPPPVASPTPTATEPAVSDEQDIATPTPPVDIRIGGYVQVAGTGVQGLSLRQGPGANYARMDVAAEGEIFVVVEGPQTTAGAPWWRIRDPDNEARVWWAIGNYLQPVVHP